MNCYEDIGYFQGKAAACFKFSRIFIHNFTPPLFWKFFGGGDIVISAKNSPE